MQPEEPKSISEPAPNGTHPSILSRIVDLGWHDNSFQGMTTQQHQVMLTWELGKLNSQGKPFMISKTMNCSLNEKATFRKWAEAMIGRQFTRAEIYGANRFNVKELLGATCLVQVEQTEKEGKVSAKVTGVVQMPEGMLAPARVNEFVYFSLSPDEYDPAVFENLSPWAKGKIEISPSYANLLVALRKKEETPAPVKPAPKMTAKERKALIKDEVPWLDDIPELSPENAKA